MTIATMKEMFVKVMRETSVVFDQYNDSQEDNIYLFGTGSNLEEIKVIVSFYLLSNGEIMVDVWNAQLPGFSGNEAKGFDVCNQLNNKEFVKYFIDANNSKAYASSRVFFNFYGINNAYDPNLILLMATQLFYSVDHTYPVLLEASQQAEQAAPSAVKRCPNCGKESVGGSKFCTGCGTPVQ